MRVNVRALVRRLRDLAVLIADPIVPKSADVWVFASCTGFASNVRRVFDVAREAGSPPCLVVVAQSQGEAERIRAVVGDSATVVGKNSLRSVGWVLRAAVIVISHDVLVTDYSSIWIDFLCTGRPLIAYTYDEAWYAEHHGVIWDYEAVFPGPRVRSGDELTSALSRALSSPAVEAELKKKYEFSRRLFHRFDDTESGRRVYEAISMYGLEGEIARCRVS